MALPPRSLVARAFRALRRLGLLGRFSVLSLAAVAALGFALAHFVAQRIEHRALANSTEEAELVTRFGITPQISGADLRAGLSQEAIDSLNHLLHAGYTTYPVEEIRIWNREGRIVYANEGGLIGRSMPERGPLTAALAGRTAVGVMDDSSDGVERGRPTKVIRAFVPLRYGGRDATPEGAFEVRLYYAPVADAIAADTHRVFLLLALGLVVLWALLFRIVQGASRRLRRQAAENEHQARHDGLTGLLNRTSFYERVEAATATTRRAGGHAAVLVVDLDRFKEVNDTLGHHAGDVLLREAAGRLHGALRTQDVLARLGGDEFAILLPDLESPSVASVVAGRVARALEEAFELDGLTVHLDASLGIALCPEHADDVETLMRRADIAMYSAKRSAAPFEVYAPEQDRHNPSRLALLGELRHALERDEFQLHYQPKASLVSGRVEGVEALLRWYHPDRGLVPPDEFIPLAEQTGVIKPLTAWVIDEALRQCAEWRARGTDLSVAVNVSVRNLLDATLPESIADALRRHEVPPSSLGVEITESTIVADQVRAVDVLTRLDALGVRLAIDDFGTGYSSLAYLKDLPVRELKIDRTFVNNMSEDGDDAFIVRSTIDLGRNLGLEVVAEGVETEAVWDQLAGLGCDLAQGYFLSRPLPAAELLDWLRARGEAEAREPEGFAFGA